VVECLPSKFKALISNPSTTNVQKIISVGEDDSFIGEHSALAFYTMLVYMSHEKSHHWLSFLPNVVRMEVTCTTSLKKFFELSF
jgi:hypothetical protein